MRAGDGLACHGDAPGVFAGQSADDMEQCRFAAARWPDQRNELALGDVERHVLDGGDRRIADAKALGDVFDRERDVHVGSDAMRFVRGRMEQLLRRQHARRQALGVMPAQEYLQHMAVRVQPV